MNDFLSTSSFFGPTLGICAYCLGLWLQKKWRNPLVNPLLVAVIATIAFLALSGISYRTYMKTGRALSYLLVPATVSLAVPLYEKLPLLKKHAGAVCIGILSGVAANLVCIFALSHLFSLSMAEFMSLLPKSITMAIGIGLSEDLGGYVTLTVASIFITGLLGSITAEAVFKALKITHPIAQGISIGTSAHAIGTARAMQMGRTQGAMSGLSIAVTGLATVGAATLLAIFM